ncbi:MAG: outer membrane beta-barrel protein [Terracidiphilus sp.]
MLKHLFLVSFFCVVFSVAAGAQVAPAATRPGPSIYAGGTASAFRLYPGATSVLPGYPDETTLGVGAFLDLNAPRWWGIEAEGRWILFHEFAHVHEDTYLVGPRFIYPIGHFKFYGKGLYGQGVFAFPYGSAHEFSPVIAMGGGVDYRLTHKISVRLFDAEYQRWWNFQHQGISPIGASIGVAYHFR